MKITSRSELLKMEVDLSVISVLSLEEGDMLIKDGQEVLIPKSMRKFMLSKLYETHLSDASMLKLARGAFFWPKMTSEIRELYKSCLPSRKMPSVKNRGYVRS